MSCITTFSLLKISDSNTKATQNPQLYPTTLVLGIYTYFSKIGEYEHCFLLVFLIFRLL